MEVTKKAWPLASAYGVRTAIDTNPDFQRPPVWSTAQKQMLIDSILRNYDVPKLYWRQKTKQPATYDVVDGQQRLRAIWDFYDGKFALPRDVDPIDGLTVQGLKYKALPHELRIRCDTYNLDVVILSESDEDETREMFLRLQNGTSLKAQEKRNAMPGAMGNFVREIAAHGFFNSCPFSNSRYTFDQMAAQMILMEIKGGPTNVKNADLNAMYRDFMDFDRQSAKAKKVRKVLDFLHRCFPEKTPEIKRFSVLSLYALVSYLLEKYVVAGREIEIGEWFIAFEAHRRHQDELPFEEQESEMLTYHEKTSHSTDASDSIQWRHDFLLGRLFQAISNLEQKDDQRLFNQEQRIAIFRRDGGLCQVKLKCIGAKCEWDNWAADHKTAWNKGGKTTVINGQLACVPCNSAKSDS